MAITVLELAEFRGVKEDESGSINFGEFTRVGLPGMGGCKGCGATIAAYNAYPTKSGYWSCEDCLGPNEGYDTAEQANRDLFADEYEWKGPNKTVDKREPDQYEGYDSTDYMENHVEDHDYGYFPDDE